MDAKGCLVLDSLLEEVIRLATGGQSFLCNGPAFRQRQPVETIPMLIWDRSTRSQLSLHISRRQCQYPDEPHDWEQAWIDRLMKAGGKIEQDTSCMAIQHNRELAETSRVTCESNQRNGVGQRKPSCISGAAVRQARERGRGEGALWRLLRQRSWSKKL